MNRPADPTTPAPAALQERAQRHRAALIAITLILVAAPLVLGTLRLLGIL